VRLLRVSVRVTENEVRSFAIEAKRVAPFLWLGDAEKRRDLARFHIKPRGCVTRYTLLYVAIMQRRMEERRRRRRRLYR